MYAYILMYVYVYSMHDPVVVVGPEHVDVHLLELRHGAPVDVDRRDAQLLELVLHGTVLLVVEQQLRLLVEQEGRDVLLLLLLLL